jgi:hypothetical protein
MLHGAAGRIWEALKTQGKFCNIRDMKMAASERPKNSINPDEYRDF